MITSLIILLLAAGAFALWRSLRTSPPVVSAPPPLPPISSAWRFVAGDDPACRVPPPPEGDPRSYGMTICFAASATAGVDAFEFVGTLVNSAEAASLLADVNGGEFTLPADQLLLRYYAFSAEGPRYVRRREVRGAQRGPWQYLGDVAPYLRPTG